jgi:hypothetical protein
MFAPRLARLMPRYQSHGRLLLDVTASASLAVAPALAWFAQSASGGAVAVALLGALLVHSSYSARRGRVYAVLVAAPYIVLGLAFLGDAVGAGAGASAMTAALALLYVWGASLHHAHRAAHARVQDAEWLRQLNMSFTDANAAAWEIDFVRQRLIGAERLSALVGRPVTFADVVEQGCFAAPEDRALVKSAFAPAPGAVRRVALAHNVLRADGSRMRLRHQAFVRTTPDGTPVRLTCVSSLADGVAQAGMPRRRTRSISCSCSARRIKPRRLRRYSNELSTCRWTPKSAIAADRHRRALVQVIRPCNGARSDRARRRFTGACAPRRRKRQSRQVAVPGQYEPRIAHPAQRHHRLCGDAAGRRRR